MSPVFPARCQSRLVLWDKLASVATAAWHLWASQSLDFNYLDLFYCRSNNKKNPSVTWMVFLLCMQLVGSRASLFEHVGSLFTCWRLCVCVWVWSAGPLRIPGNTNINCYFFSPCSASQDGECRPRYYRETASHLFRTGSMSALLSLRSAPGRRHVNAGRKPAPTRETPPPLPETK